MNLRQRWVYLSMFLKLLKNNLKNSDSIAKQILSKNQQEWASGEEHPKSQKTTLLLQIIKISNKLMQISISTKLLIKSLRAAILLVKKDKIRLLTVNKILLKRAVITLTIMSLAMSIAMKLNKILFRQIIILLEYGKTWIL